MGVAKLVVGQQLHLDDEPHVIARILDEDRYELEQRATARRSELSQDAILDLFVQGRIVFSGPSDDIARSRAVQKTINSTLLTTCTESQRALAILRMHFVKKLEGIATTRNKIEPVIESIWLGLNAEDRVHMPECPHASTVSKWIKKWQDSSFSIAALINQDCRKGNRTNRRNEMVTEIVDDAVKNIYLTLERPSIQDVLTHINDLIVLRNQGLIRSEQIDRVGISFVRTRIDLIPAYDRFAARYGKRVADVKFRTTGLGAAADLPLARASMDHHRLDLFVVDEKTLLPLGRPWLTVILDECTRMVLGYSISFDEPSALTVMRALRHALLPKIRTEGTNVSWPAWGIMDVLVVDNGVEFHGIALSYAAAQFGITIQTCPRRKPWYKGRIERFFRTVHTQLVALVPGRTFSGIVERSEYDSLKHAVITLRTLKEITEKWIVDVYHQTAHSALQETPHQRWTRMASTASRCIPSCSEWTDAAFGKPDVRMLGHQGIEFDSLFYNSDRLGALRHLHGDRLSVDIITNDEDVGYLYVIDPQDGEPIKVPAVDLSYADGMTRWQHRKCKEFRRHLAESSENAVSLAQARAQIAALIARDMNMNPKKSRRAVGRFLDAIDTPKRAPAAAEEVVEGLHRQTPTETKVTKAAKPKAKKVTPGSGTRVPDETIPVFNSRVAHQHNQEALA